MANLTPPTPQPLTERAAWKALQAHASELGGVHLRRLFADDPARGERLAAEAAGLYFDFAKQRVTGETVRLLASLADECGLRERIEAMFRGDPINTTERRPVLHVALRAGRDADIRVNGRNVIPDVHAALDAMARLAEDLRHGRWKGFTGAPIRNVVNVGIGGSDLGPRMAYEALRAYADRGLTFRFVSNVDGTAFLEAVRELDPAETAFVVSSKTFTTIETMSNAAAAREWLTDALGEKAAYRGHFVAVTENRKAAVEWGVDDERVLPMYEWVGGRYSMTSAIGISTMMAIGPDGFRELLAGFREVDEHFRATPWERNLPALMGLLGVWNADFLGAETVAVLPYSEYLHRFPAYLQQLTMESNGKRVTLDGAPAGVRTGAVYWGEPGTNGQHSFYQLLHQGTRLIPGDLIGICRPARALGNHQDLLMANLLAQAEALAFGKTEDELRAEGVDEALIPHRVCPGNQPSTVILAEALTPKTLGALIALYEHSVFTQGVVWGIDSFDQWGVELGKVLAKRIVPELEAADEPGLDHDSSTATLIRRYRALR
jgi:glucose-6-phosphate isomerase